MLLQALFLILWWLTECMHDVRFAFYYILPPCPIWQEPWEGTEWEWKLRRQNKKENFFFLNNINHKPLKRLPFYPNTSICLRTLGTRKPQLFKEQQWSQEAHMARPQAWYLWRVKSQFEKGTAGKGKLFSSLKLASYSIFSLLGVMRKSSLQVWPQWGQSLPHESSAKMAEAWNKNECLVNPPAGRCRG